MRWCFAAIVLGACGGSTDRAPRDGTSGPQAMGTGTVAMNVSGTGSVAVVDVATGVRTTLDSGSFGDASIAADGAHVAYYGADKIPKLVDRAGNVMFLESTSTNSNDGPSWGPAGTLTYFVERSGAFEIVLLAHAGATPRTIPGNGLTISNDGRRDAYIVFTDPSTMLGDVMSEDIDGSNLQTLIGGVKGYPIALTPDGSSLLLQEQDATNQIHIEVVSVADHSVVDLGIGGLPAPAPGLSRFSADGSHVLFLASGVLQSVDLATGVGSPLATIQDNMVTFALTVGYLDDQHAVYNRTVNLTPDSDVVVSTATVHIANGVDDKLIATAVRNNSECTVAAASLANGLMALVCDGIELRDLDGNLRLKHPAFSVLGISGDGGGMVTLAMDGTVEFVDIDASARTLGVAVTPFMQLPPPVLGPYATYAP